MTNSFIDSFMCKCCARLPGSMLCERCDASFDVEEIKKQAEAYDISFTDATLLLLLGKIQGA